MTRIGDIYTAIARSGRDGVFLTLRPQAQVQREFDAATGPLAGLVLAVKDNVDVAGLPTTAACPDYAYTPESDAPAVSALRSAGAVVIGKTNLDQFATGLVGTRSPYGAVRDSRRDDYISGGSSSGSAVAVALGFADIAIGTDTAGSGRVPAGLQGIVGIKATVGVVGTRGVVPACESYDCVTIFARDLDTASTAMAAMAAGAPDREWPSDVRLAARTTPVLAVPVELPGLNTLWRNAFESAVDRARSAGAQIKRIPFDDFLAAARLLYDGALVAERFAAVGEFVSGGAVSLDPTVARIIKGGKDFSAVELLADRRRVAALRTAAMGLIADCDALLVPTAPTHPRLDEVAADPVGVNSLMGTYTNFCNLFDLCAISVPAGVVDEDDRGTAQFGVTLLGRAFHDGVVEDIARRIFGAGSSAEPWVGGVVDTVRLAVFGAHLRGQPLAHQLTDLGAHWAGPMRTAASYRLSSLDTTPAKPGLVRVGDGGASIIGEEWLLSPAALGRFLAALPAPMMLGNVERADGSWVTGFGCSADALVDAEDITAFGGWVAFRSAAVAAGS
ncbi:allophanate hydrolase [Gordonia sp. TBRC 11910]|uniref:Allophanate hydrolase n=1 Tax=Gordonia asplenii TaxID=2725283 RepID=A0A848KUY8_9ACTN|nr:allophanate hydrolase [Gordonia asplenii]NMO00293.1 allophanate hydrolase [Gordonia asplenii]